MRAGIWPGGRRYRRWYAPATNLLPTTNGDGVEKTVGNFVIPANTLAVDGDFISIRMVLSYLNNTGSSQTPRYGGSLNGGANLWFSLAASLTVPSGAGAATFAYDVSISRTGPTTATFDIAFEQSGGLSYGSTRRRSPYTPITFNCSTQNTINLKMLIAEHVANPALHQITGVVGYANLLG